MKAMRKKRYWRDAFWYIVGTFTGGFLFGFVGNLLGKARV